MIEQGFFITGSDTEMGKTTLSASLLHFFSAQGLRTLGLKPVASGGNQDIQMLQQHANVYFDQAIINPFSFAEPIAPHVAAAHNNQTLSVEKILKAYEHIANDAADVVIVEGAGGWLTPLNDKETLADLAQAINYPVILIVGIRLGCINHALLTLESIQAKGLKVKGWIANCIDPTMLYPEDSIQYLEKHIAAPLLGVVPYQHEVNIAAMTSYLNLTGL